MAKRAKENLTVTNDEGTISFTKGSVYPDSVVTKFIDESAFEDVSDEALEKDEEAETTEGEAPKKKTKKSTKKVPGEELK